MHGDQRVSWRKGSHSAVEVVETDEERGEQDGEEWGSGRELGAENSGYISTGKPSQEGICWPHPWWRLGPTATGRIGLTIAWHLGEQGRAGASAPAASKQRKTGIDPSGG